MSNNKHGLSTTNFYYRWRDMKKRCYNQNHKYYKDYGGRGIKVCSAWKESFTTFRDWALANGYREALKIDRIDNDGDYEPDNCRWVTEHVQKRNYRKNVFIEINGETKCMMDWSISSGIRYQTIFYRYHIGKRGKDLIKPPRKYVKREETK